MTHTKGEWKIGKIKHSKSNGKGGYIYIDSEEWYALARAAFTPGGVENGMANAKLIAAAPELLEACKHLVAILTKEDKNFYKKHIEVFNLGINAIKKTIQ